MAKSLYIAEKPSVAREFAAALKIAGRAADGYIESENAVVTWCVGHLRYHELSGGIRHKI